jgi:hypothetical protein
MRVCEAESIPDLCFAVREWHSTTINTIGVGAVSPHPNPLPKGEGAEETTGEKLDAGIWKEINTP